MTTAQKITLVPADDLAATSPLCKLQLPELRTYGINSEGKRFNYAKQRTMAKGLELLPVWWGVLLHTSGSGVISLAEKRGWTPDEAAIWTYAQDWMNCAHYLNLTTGILVKVVSERLVAPHCGVKPWQYACMKDGTWVDHVPPAMLEHWRAAWPRVKAPTSLYPNVGSANPDVIGVENVPQEDGTFTESQYATLRAFVAERDAHHKMDIAHHRNRLLGHEDVNPFWWEQNGRAVKLGGADPGARRAVPKFIWSKVWP